jgi:hypothetical protein
MMGEKIISPEFGVFGIMTSLQNGQERKFGLIPGRNMIFCLTECPERFCGPNMIFCLPKCPERFCGPNMIFCLPECPERFCGPYMIFCLPKFPERVCGSYMIFCLPKCPERFCGPNIPLIHRYRGPSLLQYNSRCVQFTTQQHMEQRLRISAAVTLILQKELNLYLHILSNGWFWY